jgi:hypothetical protein
MKMEQTECCETLTYKIQTPGNYPEENKQHDLQLLVQKSVNSKVFFCFVAMVLPSPDSREIHHCTCALPPAGKT